MSSRRGNYGPSLSGSFMCSNCIYVSSTTKWIETEHIGKIARTRYSCINYGCVKPTGICQFFDNGRGGTYKDYEQAFGSLLKRAAK